jgi:hypothetical protein
MKLKAKAVKRTPAARSPRTPAPAARKVRGQDLGDRRLQLLLGAVR